MAKFFTARETGEKLGIEHLEVIRRLRRGDIRGRKWGWNWAIHEDEVERVKELEWYQRILEKRARTS